MRIDQTTIEGDRGDLLGTLMAGRNIEGLPALRDEAREDSAVAVRRLKGRGATS